MSVVSNLYAAKLYSEHPLAIWPLDDDVSYISLITDQQRTFEADSPYAGWTITGGTANDSLPLPDQGSPFDSDIYAGIEGSVPAVDNTMIEAISPALFSFDQCSEELGTFSVGMYLYQQSVYVNYYEFGYKYYDNFLSNWVEVLETVDATPIEQWIRLEATFNIEEFDTDDCYLIVRANVDTGGLSGDYNFIINGLTVGQWSEISSSQSLGATTEAAPVSSGIVNDVVPADQYGILEDNGYYVVENGKLLAKNEGIPMVFGSSNVTKIYPSSDETASFIFPGKTMLSEDGRYKDFTLEFWLKIRPTTKESRKIIGPLDSEDGLYVTEGFIALVIDGKFTAHNISEWYRPMIVHISLREETVSLFINGEQVGQITIDRENMELQDSDWFGVYSYSDINVMEIDCISIFPYSIPSIIAKKRFVWGQGTDPIEIVNDSFNGEEAVISFANANYTANRIYPDKERWDAGYYNNLVATTSSISVPQYSLPDVYLSGRDIKEWYEDNKLVNDAEYPLGDHPKFITFRPNLNAGSWEPVGGTNWTEQCYINFTSLTFLSNPLSAIYGIFEVEEEVLESRPLIKIVNGINGKVFEVAIDGYDVTYVFDGTELDGTGFTVTNSHFAVGFHIPTLSNAFNYELASFFGSPEVLQMYVGGDGTTTFEGKIYRVGFSDQLNYGEIEDQFDNETGIVDYTSDELLEAHYASYTLSPFFRYNQFFLDISVSSQWEEYFPLSSFASYISQRNGSRFYDLDYLQINFGYPSLIEIVETIIDNPNWVYQELLEEYAYPIQKSYAILDNSALTGYTDYADLAENTTVVFEIDTSGSSLDAFVTFQLLAEGADEPLTSFTNLKELTDSYTIYADEENTNLDPFKAYKTKFRIVDGTVIYPPKTINFKNVAIVVHFVIQQDGIISNPLRVRNLEITSKALNESSLTPIGTKSGMQIYPYTKTGIYYSGKSKNPVMIGKDNLPYLYLTEKGGIKVLQTDQDKEYGIIVPINAAKSSNYILGAAQLFMKYDIFNTPVVEFPVFSLTHQDGFIEFTVEPDINANRFKIAARNGITKQEYSGITFYQNGIPVKNPYVMKNQWNVIGFTFDSPLDMSNFTGSINLLYGASYDNVSFFKTSGLNEFSIVIPRPWSSVLFDADIDPINNLDWQYWYDENGVLTIPNEWRDVYILDEATVFSTTPSNIYSSYVGTNIVVMDDNTGISIAEDDFSMYADATWLKVVDKPV